MICNTFQFQQPFSLLITGPTMCGKTYFVKQMLASKNCIVPEPTKIYWHYGVKNDEQERSIVKSCLYPIEFVDGLPLVNNDEDIIPNSLIIIDDLMKDAARSATISNLFTRGVHHNKCSIVLIMQNIFHKAPLMRDISLNVSYLVLFKNPRDSSQINFLARQIFPRDVSYFKDAFQQATVNPNSYLLIDCVQKTDDELRLLTNIFPSQIPCCFIRKNTKTK